MAGFARHLGNFGWRPDVLSIREVHIDKKDPEHLNGLRDVPIYRTGILPDISDVYLRSKVLYHSLKGRRKVTRKELEETFALSNTSKSDKVTRRSGLKHLLLSLLVTMPDKERGWVLPAVYRAATLMRQNPYRCILTSSPPHSVHFIGYVIKLLFDVRWVADFRDPWMTPPGKKLYPTTPLSNAVESKIEEKFLKQADLVIVNTECFRDRLVSKYRNLPKGKFLYLSNGYDAEEISDRLELEKFENFTICYTGTLYLGRSPEPILKALQEIRDEGRYDVDKIRLLLVGNCHLIDGMRTADLVSSYNLDSVVKVMGFIPHRQALEIIIKSHLALLLAPDQPYQVPGKIFEYIGAGTTILAIANEGATADLIRKNGFGKAFAPDDIGGIKNFILQAIAREHNSAALSKNPLAQKFNRRFLVEKLAGHLDALLVN
jgi:glycosyltransferase involved in cell wall biosynthesis